MSTWQGANTKRSSASSAQREAESNRETVEAALNRLSRSYNAAMECVGAWHRLARTLSEKNDIDQSALDTFLSVGQTARKTFEEFVLLDPLVVSTNHADMIYLHWNYRAPPGDAPKLTSGGHRATVRQLAYLTLVNYGDLLQAGCPCYHHAHDSNSDTGDIPASSTIIDRGLVKIVKVLATRKICCWRNHPTESPKETSRLALLAYISASSLEGSDPTVWLKLACAARRLGRLIAIESPHEIPSSLLRHRRLEKHALEQAQLALPPNVPVNRTALQAYAEWKDEESGEVIYPSILAKTENRPMTITLHLTRYSWAALGRTLLRVCKDGSSFEGIATREGKDTGWPLVRLQLSPLIGLPSVALTVICKFLEPRHRRSLEGTCKALSSSVLAARAVLDHSDHIKQRVDQEAAKLESVKDSEEVASEVSSPKENHTKDRINTQGSRVSKRVRSQIITSGKRTVRSIRRNSIEFCLLSSILRLTSGDSRYQTIKKQRINWERLYVGFEIIDVSASETVFSGEKGGTGKKGYREDPDQRWGGHSLTSFVHSWCTDGVSALSLAFSFVAHIAKYSSEVFTTETGTTNALCSLIFDCFELMSRRTGLTDANVPSWYMESAKVPRDAGVSQVDLLSIDLLHAELRFKRCSLDSSASAETDGDATFISLLVPKLPQLFEELYADLGKSKLYLVLRSRCFWLTARFYIWFSKIVQNPSDSREAERIGLDYVEKNEISFAARIPTPHLDGGGVNSFYLKELSEGVLLSFRNDIQAASVVLVAQERFQDAVGKLEAGNEAIDCAIRDEFNAIGASLFGRYKPDDAAASSRYLELIDDVLPRYEARAISNDESLALENILPTGRIDQQTLVAMSAPSILAILVACLRLSPHRERDIVDILSTLTTATVARSISLRNQVKFSGDSIDSDDDFSDDDSMSTEASHQFIVKNALRTKIQQHDHLLRFLITKLKDRTISELVGSDRSSFIRSEITLRIFPGALTLVARCYLGYEVTSESAFDVKLFRTLRDMYHALCEVGSERVDMVSLSRSYLVGLIRIVRERHYWMANLIKMKTSRRNRSSIKELIKSSAELVGVVCLNIGQILSQSKGLIRNTDNSADDVQRLLATLCNSLLWFWDRSGKSEIDSEISFDSLSKLRLRVPIATALCGLCYAETLLPRDAASSRDQMNSFVSLVEFYDSDASAIEWLDSDDDGPGNGNGGEILEDKLRAISQAVHCIGKVFASIEENEATVYKYDDSYVTAYGPALPLVVARAMNEFADILLLDFSPETMRSEALWSNFPAGTRTVGTIIDAALHQAYKCLYGFTLVSSNEESSSTSAAPDRARKNFPLENTAAAVRLYRCVIRAYGHGRKSPPKAALNTILGALPPLKESGETAKVHAFLFNASVQIGPREICALVQKSSGWEHPFHVLGVEDWGVTATSENHEQEEESIIVRRGVSELLAQGPMPQYQEGGTEISRRSGSAQTERELAKKFFAIIESLCMGRILKCEGWYEAAQCLILKADLIADRIGLSSGHSSKLDFYPNDRDTFARCHSDLAQLQAAQEREYNLRRQGWVELLGKDLLPYVKHAWSSYSSLKRCSNEIKELIVSCEDKDGVAFERNILSDISNLLEKEDFSSWQMAWGGIFVSALRRVAARCISLALYIPQREEGPANKDLVVSEITESLGTSFYSELVGRQVYGYPMHVMTPYQVKEVAGRAMVCFERTVTANSESAKAQGEDEVEVTWDLRMMMGKCEEKIAKTYRPEAFIGEDNRRSYERHMSNALSFYAVALRQAKELESNGDLIADQNGGSSHGSTEAFYRLHASRLKCLIHAVNRSEDDRELAELEALRLTEAHWYAKPGTIVSSTRDRVWHVLADIVAALAQCRIEHSFFHRSVYRHAQALMWAPVLSDPVNGRIDGGKGTIPATRAVMLRGLNYATNAAHSAMTVIDTLFDKKRAQLCAVWVTTSTTASALETLNSSVRKYDSLRGKYIGAYLDSLQLCQRQSELETFSRWIYGCPRDMTSLFAVTAGPEEPKNVKSHATDSLLIKRRSVISRCFITTIKRHTNNSLAAVLHIKLNSTTTKDQKQLDNFLKSAYACFLRLNMDSSSAQLKKVSAYPRQIGVKEVVDLLIAAYERIAKDGELTMEQEGDWSGGAVTGVLLENAVSKCKQLFPSLSATFYTNKKASSSKGKKQKVEDKREDTSSENVKRSFEVSVPEGLKAGNSFLASIHGIDKKVRLTVPEGNATTLRFALQVTPEAIEPAVKKRKVEEAEEKE